MRISVIAGAIALLIGGCASQVNHAVAQGGRYPSLEEAISSVFRQAIVEVPEGERPMVASCYSRSVVSGVPAKDQVQMLEALNSQSFDADDIRLFNTYFPTDRDGRVNPNATARAEKNAKLICPDVLLRYPKMFT